MVSSLRVHIFFTFLDGPFGGGNQFLKALAGQWRASGNYTDDPAQADAVLFNSHRRDADDRFAGILALKRQRPELVLAHRVDGPMSLVRGDSPGIDRTVFLFNRLYADGTIFQSEWSRLRSEGLGMRRDRPYSTILNAPDPDLAFDHGRTALPSDRRIRIVAASWSSNAGKGFADYQWLDENLDFDRYEMRFVGNSPVTFRNIQILPPQQTAALMDTYRDCDIFITGSRNDPCSNALIEALHCGLPAVALRDGGHPEIVDTAGELYGEVGEVPGLLDRIVADYAGYRARPKPPVLEVVADAYLAFLTQLHDSARRGEVVAKRPSLSGDCLLQGRDALNNGRVAMLARRARNKWRRMTGAVA